MRKFNTFFRKNLFYLVLASMFLGFLFGWQFQDFALKLKALIVPFLFLMIYVMIVPMEFKEMVDLRKYKSNETYKLIDGSIFTSDPWRIQALMLISIGMEGKVEIVGEPRKMMSLANGLAIAGLPHVVEIIKDGDDEPIWNLSDNIETLIKHSLSKN